jgi:hypothetical protein
MFDVGWKLRDRFQIANGKKGFQDVPVAAAGTSTLRSWLRCVV